jgi:pyruvate formate lyase activating enzyme
VIFLKVNFGGFVPLSTVDWRGRSVCTVFLRGCPVRCHYCHNREIQTGSDQREVDEIVDLIRSSRLAVSGVIFSGGEPTMQKEALLALAAASKQLGLKVGIQTNGVFPETLEALLDAGLLDKVCLDIKARWEHYHNLLKVKPEVTEKVKQSLAICKEAFFDGRLEEFEVVNTLLKRIADKIRRRVKIRTREDGEVVYENNQIIVAESIVLTDIMQARRRE